jgi:hypothetical protein
MNAMTTDEQTYVGYQDKDKAKTCTAQQLTTQQAYLS